MKKITKPLIIIGLLACRSYSFAADYAYCPVGSICSSSAEGLNKQSIAPGTREDKIKDQPYYTLQMGVASGKSRDMHLQCTSGSLPDPTTGLYNTTYPPISAKVHCTNIDLECGKDKSENNDGQLTKIHCHNQGKNHDYHLKVEEVDCTSQPASGLNTTINHDGCDWDPTYDSNGDPYHA